MTKSPDSSISHVIIYETTRTQCHKITQLTSDIKFDLHIQLVASFLDKFESLVCCGYPVHMNSIDSHNPVPDLQYTSPVRCEGR